jgi:hypothetical protein
LLRRRDHRALGLDNEAGERAAVVVLMVHEVAGDPGAKTSGLLGHTRRERVDPVSEVDLLTRGAELALALKEGGTRAKRDRVERCPRLGEIALAR